MITPCGTNSLLALLWQKTIAPANVNKKCLKKSCLYLLIFRWSNSLLPQKSKQRIQSQKTIAPTGSVNGKRWRSCDATDKWLKTALEVRLLTAADTVAWKVPNEKKQRNSQQYKFCMVILTAPLICEVQLHGSDLLDLCILPRSLHQGVWYCSAVQDLSCRLRRTSCRRNTNGEIARGCL